MLKMSKNILCLFDIDGTLTKPRQVITSEVKKLLIELNKKVSVGFVGGSDLEKITEQMDFDTSHARSDYQYFFAENGLHAFKKGELIGKESILNHIGEHKLQTLINFCLEYMSKLTLPAKRGNFVEFRNGLINICPVGRSCSQLERDEFASYDKVHNIREKFVKKLEKTFPDYGLIYAIGGQISFDCFPVGWDKTFCLKYIKKDGYETIHFFGDKTSEGGNDYELYKHPDVIGHAVANPEDTIKQIKELFKL